MSIFYFNEKEKLLILNENNKKIKYYLSFEFCVLSKIRILIFKKYKFNLFKPYTMKPLDELLDIMDYQINCLRYVRDRDYKEIKLQENKKTKIFMYKDNKLYNYDTIVEMLESEKIMNCLS